MTAHANRQRASYAYANRADLPGRVSTLDRTDIAARSFETARTGGKSPTEGRGSAMVARDKPHPAPRPSPDMAIDSDRAAFNAAWNQEAREARKAAFIKERTDRQTGGRVRVLKRSR